MPREMHRNDRKPQLIPRKLRNRGVIKRENQPKNGTILININGTIKNSAKKNV